MPWYVVPFDDQGRCTGPRTRAELIARAATGDYSDIIVFCHGWNNDWRQATGRYDDFLAGYLDMRRQRGLPVPSDFAPLLVGIFWPSKLLVAREDRAPLIAGDEVEEKVVAGEAAEQEVADERDQVTDLAAMVPSESAQRLFEITQQDALTEQDAMELASMVAPLYATDQEETGEQAAPTTEDVFASWVKPTSQRSTDLTVYGRRQRTADPSAAGFLDFLNPREIVRGASVWLMKDRAGRVGARGVGPMLADLLDSDARLHLVGHSYGAKVVLSAITSPERVAMPVRSVLLLQPAVSHLCFADDADGKGSPGGYRLALERVQLPILSTFSRQDVPLTKAFHVALRRGSDVGEAQIAGDEPPNRYAALGGFGPRGLADRSKIVDVLDPVARYDLPAGGVRVVGIDASRTIPGHGEVSNESTWWMLYDLMTK